MIEMLVEHPLAVTTIVFVLGLFGVIWLATRSVNQLLHSALPGLSTGEWKLRPEFRMNEARAEGVVSGRKAVVEVLGLTQLALKVAVEYDGDATFRIARRTKWHRLFSSGTSLTLAGVKVQFVGVSEAAPNPLKVAQSVRVSSLLGEVLSESSAQNITCQPGSMTAIVRQSVRSVLEAEHLETLLRKMVDLVEMWEAEEYLSGGTETAGKLAGSGPDPYLFTGERER